MYFIQWKTIHGLGEDIVPQAVDTVAKGFAARFSFVEH